MSAFYVVQRDGEEGIVYFILGGCVLLTGGYCTDENENLWGAGIAGDEVVDCILLRFYVGFRNPRTTILIIIIRSYARTTASQAQP